MLVSSLHGHGMCRKGCAALGTFGFFSFRPFGAFCSLISDAPPISKTAPRPRSFRLCMAKGCAKGCAIVFGPSGHFGLSGHFALCSLRSQDGGKKKRCTKNKRDVAGGAALMLHLRLPVPAERERVVLLPHGAAGRPVLVGGVALVAEPARGAPGARDAAQLAVLVHALADPVEARVAPDRLVHRVNEDHLVEAVGRVLVNPVRVENAKRGKREKTRSTNNNKAKHGDQQSTTTKKKPQNQKQKQNKTKKNNSDTHMMCGNEQPSTLIYKYNAGCYFVFVSDKMQLHALFFFSFLFLDFLSAFESEKKKALRTGKQRKKKKKRK
jgi:hypothetical protein